MAVEANLDGTSTEYFEMECAEAPLLAVLRDIFEEHWDRVIFGPCIEGAVFEGRFPSRPRVTVLDGYATVEIGGPSRGTSTSASARTPGSASLPTPPELARWRRCSRAAFFETRDPKGRPSSWGFRMWNGRAEQMLTVFFPNPWIEPTRQRYVDTPDWSRLDLWMHLRSRHTGIPPSPPPPNPTRPISH